MFVHSISLCQLLVERPYNDFPSPRSVSPLSACFCLSFLLTVPGQCQGVSKPHSRAIAVRVLSRWASQCPVLVTKNIEHGYTTLVHWVNKILLSKIFQQLNWIFYLFSAEEGGSVTGKATPAKSPKPTGKEKKDKKKKVRTLKLRDRWKLRSYLEIIGRWATNGKPMKNDDRQIWMERIWCACVRKLEHYFCMGLIKTLSTVMV